MAAVDAKALADYGTDRYGMRYPVHFTAWRTSQMSVLLSYCMIPFYWLLGFSTVSTRLPMLVISCLGLLALYLFGRQLARQMDRHDRADPGDHQPLALYAEPVVL